MSRVKLFPRLSPLGVATVLERMANGGVELKHSIEFLNEYASLISYGPSGGARAVPAEITGIGRQLREIATDCGFPDASEAEAKAKFDRQATAALATVPELDSGEALRDDVWSFIAAVIAVDVAVWRYPSPPRERLAGGARNVFQRLWTRGRVLDRGEGDPDRWKYIDALSEDAMVQIFERASIAGTPRLARTIADAWVSTADRLGRGRMEDIMRRAMKLIRLRNEIIDLSFLSDHEMAEEVNSAFRIAAGSAEEGRTGSVAEDRMFARA
ncbi:DUF6339 family protein [Oricola sp.]|uniref:DUF6339 family protein n=1 Tax=Oricola sp. TaxID=1979950 RepID=UPI0035169DAA